MGDQLKIVKMAEQILNTSRITGLNWDISKNTICVKSFKSFYVKKDKSEIKVEFLDENRRRCQLSLKHFYNLCELRNSVSQITSLLNDSMKSNEPIKTELKTELKPKVAESTLLFESVIKFEYAKALLSNLPSATKFYCTGCQLKTIEHQCLMLTTDQQLELWFDNLLALVDEGYIIQAIKKSTFAFDFIDEELRHDFIDKLTNDQFRIEMKTEDWKNSLLQTAIRISHLESRFQLPSEEKLV